MSTCPRCNCEGYVNMYADETKCMVCGYTRNNIPEDILKEYMANLGKRGDGQMYIRESNKKFH